MGAHEGLGRRAFLTATVAAAGTACAADATPVGRTAVPPPRAVAPARHRDRPNILVIVTDDQPKDLEWALPKTRAWLGERGVEFTRANATTPLCAPSRSSIFSGRYAHNHGVLDNYAKLNLDQDATVQRHLAGAGYRNGMFGKFLNEWRIASPPAHFEDFAVLSPVGYVDGRFNHNGRVAKLPGYTTHHIRDFALDFIRRGASDSRPWFAYVAPYATHAPFTPERRYEHAPVPVWEGRPSVAESDKSDKPPFLQGFDATLSHGRRIRRQQGRSLMSVDDAVQAFRDELVATGQLENTLVIFIGDNGFLWGDHGWVRKSVPYRPAYEVPMYLSWPARGLDAGGRDDRLAANIDLSPTILEAAGIAPTTPQDGLSLLGDQTRDHLLLEFWQQGGDPRPPHSWTARLTKTTQYTEYHRLETDAKGLPTGSGEVLFREFYDLAADPYQLTNKLHGATEDQESAWNIPSYAAELRRARQF